MFGEAIRGSSTYRPEVLGRVGVVATGRHFAAEAGMRMLAAGGNAIDAGVAATFAAAVSEISHFGLGGEAPIVLHLAERGEVVVINGQGVAPLAASAADFRAAGAIPTNGPSAGTVPAVVDALAIALAEFGTRSLAETLTPAMALAAGFPWYEFLTFYFEHALEKIRRHASGARVYLQGPGQSIPPVGSVFCQPELAATLGALAAAETQHAALGRKAAIYAARDVFYSGDIGQRIVAAVQADGGLLSAADMRGYRGRVEVPSRLTYRTIHGNFEVCKSGFWGQGPVLLQALALLQDFDLHAMGHNSTAYVHTITEALKLALADRDYHYGDPDFSAIPAAGLLSPAYATARRPLIDPDRANNDQRPGDPWAYQSNDAAQPTSAGRANCTHRPHPARPLPNAGSPDTTCVNVADARGNLFSAAPSSAWVFGGTFIAGNTGVPLGNRMQAFVLEEGHPNVLAPGKRPRTTLSPTVVLKDGQPLLALSSPGGDAQDQQALQVLLNIAVFGMSPQRAIEAPRFNSLHHERTFDVHDMHRGVLEVEDRVDPEVIAALSRLGHAVRVVGPFMMDTGTTLAGIDSRYGTLFGAGDVRRQRAVTGW